MILVDYSGSVFASISVELNRNMGVKTDINFLRHLILNQLRSYHKKFSKEYGEMVICLDCTKTNWRNELFPAYKYQRKKNRINSTINWSKIFEDVNILTEEFKKELPYKFIQVDKLEADDIIAILVKEKCKICNDLYMLIISNDKDYKQLQKYSYVKQYYPRKQMIIKENNPDFALQDLIIRGDKSDGIPNIRSDKNIFVEGVKRQTPISTDFMRNFLKNGTKNFTIFEKERYEFNKILISFDEIPEHYNNIVIEEYSKNKNFKRLELLQYLAKNKLRELIDNIGDF